ncbi:MAG TPA: T9SS type A sorting domain-containing protein [Candidatus Kapabacteria bacterium]|nr:T9SS type A sorting domain-containing protein [Candidatus Kapabacteria bacterium]
MLLKAQEITNGKKYWFALPYAKMLQYEEIRGNYPIELWLSSKVNTKATLKFANNTEKSYDIKANQVTQVAISDEFMCRESEVITNNGIYISALDPISVVVYYSYKWTGETFRVIPVEGLGLEYVTLNLYQDKTDELKPAQILIVATEDSTLVKYTPTKPTAKVNADVTKQITLMKGQTFLILGRNDNFLVQNWDSDITGTSISSNKPIAVFSGHTKGAFPEYFTGYKSTYQEHYANFARNMLIEQMLPFEMLGKEYISVPIKYLDRQRGLSGVENDYGDLIRFVASKDSTFIYKMKKDGNGLLQISKVLKKGEYFDILNQVEAAYYKSNNPVLVGQYGKAWWNDPGMMGITEIIDDKSNDEPQNPYLSGQGMLITLIPIPRWCSYENFYSPTNIDNFIYLTFREEDKDNIYFDEKKITSLWKNSIKQIAGTPYSYITEVIGSGNHRIEGKGNTKWAAYAYGNWDRVKDGYAYGYPISFNIAYVCDDSLIRTITEIPKGYEANPGDTITMDFKYYKKPGEKYDLVRSNIKSITARVYFKDTLRNDYSVYPVIENGCEDIIKEGTMTEDWVCQYAKVVDRRILEVAMTGDSALAANDNDILFKFKMYCFLSNNDGKINSLPCSISRHTICIEVDSVPGDIKIAPVCVNNLRLIKLSGVEYSISQNIPNPAFSNTTINYSVGIEANTSIKLYNTNGDFVANLVEQILKPGYYSLDINVLELDIPDGLYYYKIESGLYYETKKMVIAK